MFVDCERIYEMFTYGYIKEEYEGTDTEYDYVYGVELCYQKEGASIRVNYISGVFTDEDSAKSFVELCNRLELSPVHFYDAVEDAVS